MARNVQLLLLESVENLGIVGDVVTVKPGYARNFLLPMGLAEKPTTVRISSLKEARAHAEAEMSALRRVREEIIGRLEDVSVTVERSSNDQGALYGSVTQRDIADALVEAGYGVDVKAVRLAQPIRRVGTYAVVVQFERDLKTEVSLVVKADRELDMGLAADAKPEGGGEAPRRERRPDYEAVDAIETSYEEEPAPARDRDRDRDRGRGRGGRQPSR